MLLPDTSIMTVQDLQEHMQELLAAPMGNLPVQCPWPSSLHAECSALS